MKMSEGQDCRRQNALLAPNADGRPKKTESAVLSTDISTFSITDVFLLATVTSWGTSYLFTKLGLLDLPPLLFSSYRTLISAPILVFILYVKEKNVGFRKEHFALFILLGMTGNFINRIFWTYGIYYTTVSNASILWSTSPIFVGIYSVLLGWERIRTRFVSGIIICFAGVYLLVNKGFSVDVRSIHLKGDLIVLIAAVSWATFTVLSRPLLGVYSVP
jgi:drug/metabolite transporter (DMT)-like permease